MRTAKTVITTAQTARRIGGLILLFGSTALHAPAEEVHILARDLSGRSSNVAPEYARFDNLTLCVGKKGFMEWTATVRGGPYYLHFYYCSRERRPCRLSINGQAQKGTLLGGITGGWMSRDLRWQSCGPFELEPGRNRIRLTAEGFMPHLKGLTVSTSEGPPDKSVYLTPEEVKTREKALLAEYNLDGLRSAITCLSKEYKEEYPDALTFLARLDKLEKTLTFEMENGGPAKTTLEQIRQLRREALVRKNPLLNFDDLLFVKRYTYQSNHYYTDYINGCKHFGGNLCALSLSDGKVTELAPKLNGGIFGRFDLSFDGRRIVFDYKSTIGEGFRIWETGIDGQGLRQLTFPPKDEQERIKKYKINQMYQHHTDDMHPCYLPDGAICFISTRCERGILCDAPDLFSTTTLYRMDKDGRNMEVLSNSPVSESSPSVTNDGRILYTRWEYVDKADVVIKCLWAMRPDGTGSAEIFGNDITFPDTLLHGRAVPGHNNLFAVIGAPHMPLGVGTVIKVNTNRSIRTREPMTYVTPDLDIRSEHGYYHRRNGRWARDNRGPLYGDVQPLNDKFFLVVCNPDKPFNDVRAYGIYLLDVFGNRVLIHRDAKISCWQPIPLRPRKRPPVLPASRPPGKGPATLVMSNVYRGLDGVPPGTIKYLRVMETLPRPWAARRFWTGDAKYQQHAVVSMNGSLHVKRLHGIVPVEEDGSAHFQVPPDKNLFFQVLDENFMEVQRMRTFVNLRPGETRSCIGCHGERRLAPSTGLGHPLAIGRPASALAAQPGEVAPRAIHYVKDVQPILDRHCVRCHGGKKTEGKLDLTGELTTLFNRSYENLLRRNLVQVFHENQPKTGDAAPIPPYTLGSHASKLIKMLREGHEGATLPREEFITLVTWIDANSPYYGTYFGRRNIKYRDHADFRTIPSD